MEGRVSCIKPESPPFAPSGEPSCDRPHEAWAVILPYLEGADISCLMRASTRYHHMVVTEFKLSEPLEGEPSKLLVQAARTNDRALVFRCFRAGVSAAKAKALSSTLAIRIARQVRGLEGRAEDAASARFALRTLIRKSPEALYDRDESDLQRALKKCWWDEALILLQCGLSVNHKDRVEGAKAPIVTCLESARFGERPPRELIHALLGEGLECDALNHPFGSPVWLVEDFATKLRLRRYTVPESFKKRLGDFLKDNPEQLNASRELKLPGWSGLMRVTTPLHRLIDEGSVKWLKWLLEIGADPNIQDGDGRAPLAHCIKAKTPKVEDRLAMAEALIAKGADLNAQDKDGNTALHEAGECETPEFVEFLVRQRGIDLKVQNRLKGDDQGTAVLIAGGYSGREKHVLALLQAGASVLDVSAEGTPLLAEIGGLHGGEEGAMLDAVMREKTKEELEQRESVEACWLPSFCVKEDLELYELVLKKAPDLNGVDREGRTALCNWATRLNWPEVERLLDLGARANVGKPPLHAALRAAGSATDVEHVLGGSWDRLLTKETAQGALRALLSANWAGLGEEAEGFQLSLCKKLLKHDDALDMKKGFRRSPLGMAAALRRLDLIEAMLSDARSEGQLEELPWIEEAVSSEGAEMLFRGLFRMGFPASFVGSGDKTLLHLAVEAQNAPLISYLASEKGMPLAALDARGDTALHRAVKVGSSRSLEALIEAQVPLESLDRQGLTPLARACFGWVDEDDDEELWRPYESKLLLKAGANPNVSSVKGEPLEVCLCRRGERGWSVVREWLPAWMNAGWNPAAQDGEGRTLLHRWAAESCKDFLKGLPKELALLKAQDLGGNTPLHFALEHSEAALVLLQHFSMCEDLGSVFDIPNKDGVTPRQMVLDQADGLLERLNASERPEDGRDLSFWKARLHWNVRCVLIDLALEKRLVLLASKLLAFGERRDDRIRSSILVAAVEQGLEKEVEGLFWDEHGDNFDLAGAFLRRGLPGKALDAVRKSGSAVGGWLLDQERPDLLLRWSREGGVPTSETVERVCEDVMAHKELIEAWTKDYCVKLTSSAIRKFIEEPKSHKMLVNWLEKKPDGLDESATLYAFTQGHVGLGLELLKALKPWHVKSIGSVADDKGRTLGHLAVIHGDEDFVRRYPCDPHRQDLDGNTLMHLAALYDRQEVAKKLAPDFFDGSPDDWRVNQQNKPAFQIILERHGRDPAWLPCIEGYLGRMRRDLPQVLCTKEERGVIYRLIKEKGLTRRAAELMFKGGGHRKTGLSGLELSSEEIREGLDLDRLPQRNPSSSPESSSKAPSSSASSRSGSEVGPPLGPSASSSSSTETQESTSTSVPPSISTGKRESLSGPLASSSSEVSLASQQAAPRANQSSWAKRAFVVSAAALAAVLGLTLFPRIWRSLKLLARKG